MKKVLLELADESFVVSQETASRISAIVPPDRYISISAAKNDDEDESDEDESDEDDDDDNGNKKKSSVFQRYQPKLSDREKEQAKRIAKALSKSKK